MKFAQNGDRGMLITLGDEIDLDTWRRALRLKERLASYPGVAEAVLGFSSVLVVFDGPRPPQRELEAFCLEAERVPLPPFVPSRVFRVPVCYGGEYGPDLEWLAGHCGLTAEEVVARHCGTDYPVMVVGFAPGFPYLGGLDPRLAAPRLDSPRPKVPAGSVAVAGLQTGVYPLETPGGWRIVGRTPLRLFDPAARPPVAWRPGDAIRFEPVDEAGYRRFLGNPIAIS